MYKKYLVYLFVLTVTALGLAAPNPVYAECNGQYGGGQYGSTACNPSISVDKKVRNPITGEFKDNLVAGDATYSTSSEVIYSLNITNSGNEDLTTVTVTDTLPNEL